MNPNRQFFSGTTATQAIPIAIQMTEVAEVAIPVRRQVTWQDSSQAWDKLREDMDLAGGSHHHQRPTNWSPLNEF